MKKFIFAAVVLTSLPALAIDWTEKNERAIYDLMYLPKAGTIFGQTYYNSTAYSSTAHLSGEEIAEIEVAQVDLTQFAGYSITDRLAVALQVSYLLKGTQDINFTAASGAADSETDSKGLGDPALSVKYRLLDQQDSKVNLDITPKYTISTGDAESATDDDDGNSKDGGSTFGLDVTVGKKYAEAQWSAFIGLDLLQEATSKDATTDEKSKAEDHTEFRIGGAFQRHMNEKWIFDIQLIMASISDYKDKTGTEYQKYKDQGSFQISPKFTYVSSPDLAFTLGLDLISYADYKTEDEANTTIKYEENTAANLQLGAKYQF